MPSIQPVPNRLGPPPPIVATINTSMTRPATTSIGTALGALPVVLAEAKPPIIRCLLCLVGGPFLWPNATMATCLTNVCTTPLALAHPMPPWKRNISRPTTRIWPNDPLTVAFSTTITPAMTRMVFAIVPVFAIRATTITVVQVPTNVRNAPTPPPIGD